MKFLIYASSTEANKKWASVSSDFDLRENAEQLN